MLIQHQGFDAEQLAQFKALQRRAYATLEEAAAGLKTGDTEALVARRLRRAFAQQGVSSYFHVPVALFGERTAYPGAFGPFEALPTQRALAEGDAVILDAAPVCDGYMVDVSLAVPRPGGSPAFAQADALLREVRTLVLTRTRERRATMREIAREVDRLIVERGYENCHRKHIGMVLAHRMARIGPAWLARRRIWGLSPLPVGWFFWRSFRSLRKDPKLTPNWNHTRQCDCLPQPGLWAMEPHVGRGALGSKFEEILVVTGDDAYYLDEDLPHHRRWAAAS